MTITINGSGTITGVTTLGTTLTSPTLTTPIVTTTIGVGNATPSASGSGISFPATQSASSDANTLDDYEEGTFTPSGLDQSGHAFPSYIRTTGRYTKVGRLVNVVISLRNNGSTTGMTTSQQLKIAGLPFTPQDYDVYFTPCFAQLVNLAPSTWYSLTAAFDGGTGINIYSSGGDTTNPYTPTAFTVANFEGGSGSEFNINFWYTVA